MLCVFLFHVVGRNTKRKKKEKEKLLRIVSLTAGAHFGEVGLVRTISLLFSFFFLFNFLIFWKF